MPMFVEIAGSTAVVRDIEDLTSLSVRTVSDETTDMVADALQHSGLGVLRDGRALLDVSELRKRGPKHDLDWARSFVAMTDYAASHDWTEDNGRFFVAHLETADHGG
ncbi:hypothetical protein HQO84_25445 [Rhodococcus fascians]|nr:hypothetical protein [Rhodococcus fascians]MBY3999463.1 hypothetical protein [Rhodococcus fascians]MBY4004996.1 hypothetical protein [Rhodococcus fascians]MBY4010131.1 hypothetical protein [Rhodococcus fascians]MBY4020203.1 hypothetical protein [Rhodococcus fascians]